MGRAASLWKWTYSAYDKTWRGSRGTGTFLLQSSRTAGKWYAMHAPFLQTPIVLGEFDSKQSARRFIEGKFQARLRAER